MQEAMIELAQQDCEPANVQAWLFRCVRFRAINITRGEERRRRHQRAAASQGSEWFVDELGSKLQTDDLKHALNDLSLVQREIVIARIWGELTFEQIANLVEASTSAVHRHYYAALACMQASLTADRSSAANQSSSEPNP